MTWDKKPLGDVAEFELGKMLDKRKNKGEYRPYLANVNVRWGEFELNDLREMRFEEMEQERYGLKYGDIVMCEGGEPGRCALWKDQIPGMMFQKALHRIRPGAQLDNRFLYYSFLYRGQTGQFDQYCTGATIKHLPRQDLAKVEVELPPLAIQRRVASILSCYDDLIENNTRRIDILEEIARRLFEEWFVHFRFQGHEQVRFKKTDVGRVPDGWEPRRLEDVASINPTTKVPKEGNKLFLPMSALSERSMVIGTPELKTGNSGAKFQNGDTLVARITPCLENGKTGYVDILPDDQPTACGSTEFIVLRSLTLCPEMIYLLARSTAFRDVAIKSMSGATGRQRVRVESLREFPVIQPDPKTLKLFTDCVRPMFKQVRVLANKNTNLRAQRDLLLPKLVSGELDVSSLSLPIDKDLAAA